jgi:hypothetical protein
MEPNGATAFSTAARFVSDRCNALTLRERPRRSPRDGVRRQTELLAVMPFPLIVTRTTMRYNEQDRIRCATA